MHNEIVSKTLSVLISKMEKSILQKNFTLISNFQEYSKTNVIIILCVLNRSLIKKETYSALTLTTPSKFKKLLTFFKVTRFIKIALTSIITNVRNVIEQFGMVFLQLCLSSQKQPLLNGNAKQKNRKYQSNKDGNKLIQKCVYLFVKNGI